MALLVGIVDHLVVLCSNVIFKLRSPSLIIPKIMHYLSKGIEFTKVGKVYYLYQPGSSKKDENLYTLEGSAYEIYHGIIHGEDKTNLVDRILNRYSNVSRVKAQNDLNNFIDDLVLNGILTRA